MKRYLSYGGGVNSEALRLWLVDQDIEFEAVYVDHGCDWPETRNYVRTVPNLTIIRPNYRGFSNLYDFCLYYQFVPSFKHRWCSDQFKVQPLHKYFDRPCISYIGFAADEANRCKKNKLVTVDNRWPLVKIGMTRSECKEFISSHDRQVPDKSSCWFCPMQKRWRWKKLKRQYPKLYAKAKTLEQANMKYRESIGKKPLTLLSSGKELEVVTMENQLELF